MQEREILQRHKLEHPVTAGAGTYIAVAHQDFLNNMHEITCTEIPTDKGITFDEVVICLDTFEGRRSLSIHLLEVVDG